MNYGPRPSEPLNTVASLSVPTATCLLLSYLALRDLACRIGPSVSGYLFLLISFHKEVIVDLKPHPILGGNIQ